jgi:hypothetical protein
MATSGTTAFELDVSDTIEEAYERLQMELRSGYQSRTARRSLNLLLQHLSNRQINLWKLVLTSQALTQGTTSYTLSSDILDITDVVLRRGTTDTTMNRLSRHEYQTRPNKTSQGRPSQYWLDRKTIPVLYVYLAPENSTDTIRFHAMERIEDISTSQNTIDIPSRFAPAITSGLTYYLARKFKPDRIADTGMLYEQELQEALNEDRERVPFRAVPKVARV